MSCGKSFGDTCMVESTYVAAKGCVFCVRLLRRIMYYLVVTFRVTYGRFGHSVRRPGQFVCPVSDTICPNSDKIYLTIVTFIFLLLFNEKRDSSLPSGLWIVLFWLPAETLSLNRLREPRIDRQFTT